MILYRITYPPKILILCELYEQGRLNDIREQDRQLYYDILLEFIEKLQSMVTGAKFTRTEVTEQLQAFTDLKNYIDVLWKINHNMIQIETNVNFL